MAAPVSRFLVHPDILHQSNTSRMDQDVHHVAAHIREDMRPDEFDQLVRVAPGYQLTYGGRVGFNALGTAASLGNRALVAHIAALGGAAVLNLGNYFGATPLIEATMRRHYETVADLIDLGADVNLKLTHSSGDSEYIAGRTALNYAIKARHVALTILLLRNGAKVSRFSVTPEDTTFLLDREREIRAAYHAALDPQTGLQPELEKLVLQGLGFGD